MEVLRKDHHAQFESLLTTEQKKQIEQKKEARKAKIKEYGSRQGER